MVAARRVNEHLAPPVRYTSAMTRWTFVFVLFAACSSKSGDGGGSGSAAPTGSSAPAGSDAPKPAGSGSGSAAAAAGSGSGSAAAPAKIQISALPGIDAAALCADSALLLVDVPLADAGAKYCAACGASDAKACSAKWPDDIVEPGKPADERANRMRNTIFAAYGYPFKKEQWKKLFGGKAWYKPNPAFKDGTLSKTAEANVAALKKAAATAGVELDLAPGDKGTVEVGGKSQPVAVEADGSKVTVGAVTVLSREHVPEAAEGLGGAMILDLDRKKPGKQLALRYSFDEDVEVWEVYDLSATKATYVGEVPAGDVRGDGTVVVTSAQCGVTTVTTYRAGDKKFVKAGEKKTGKHDASKCVACPYVYLVTPRGAKLQGEILRYQAGAATNREDTLVLDEPSVAAGQIVVVLREVKAETTYLGAIELEVDGRIVDPIDRGPVVIASGTAHRFAFPWLGPPPRRVVLRATGYYIPQ
jgi:hypothetical protein